MTYQGLDQSDGQMCIFKMAHLKTHNVLPNKENNRKSHLLKFIQIYCPGNDLHFLFVSGVFVRKWHKNVRVCDAFVEDESAAFGTCDGFEMLGGWVSPEEIGVNDGYVASIVEGVS